VSSLILDFEEAVIRTASKHSSEIDFIQEGKFQAINKLQNLKFPNKKSEDWKYYNFENILNAKSTISNLETFSGTQKPSPNEIKKIIEQYVFQETMDNFIITVNGEFEQEFSKFKSQPDAVTILNFNSKEEINSDLQSVIKENFDFNKDQNYFEIVNTALFDKGFMVKIADNYQSQKPLQILHISNKESFNQIRSLIIAGKNSKIEIVVSYVGIANSRYYTNAVVDCILEESAHLKLDKIQNDSNDSTRLYHYNCKLKQNSNFEFNSFSIGAKSSRDQIKVDINGEGANASINGLYVVNETRSSHHQVTVNHNVPNSSSSQVFKGLILDNGIAEFNGLIEVAQNAHHSNAAQLNKNLLLSPNAHIDSRPQLNILNHDVKCSHGSTIGRLNQEELFYLISRGLSQEEARIILTYSFCQEIINRIGLNSARNYASNLAFAKLGATSNQAFKTLAENSKFKTSRYNT